MESGKQCVLTLDSYVPSGYPAIQRTNDTKKNLQVLTLDISFTLKINEISQKHLQNAEPSLIFQHRNSMHKIYLILFEFVLKEMKCYYVSSPRGHSGYGTTM